MRVLVVVCLAVALVPLVEAKSEVQPFSSPMLGIDGKFTHLFLASGFFEYHCEPHPFMTGTVNVVPDAPIGNFSVEIIGNRFLPEHLVLSPGSNVTWTNNDSLPHTVTQTVEEERDTPGPAAPLVASVLVLAVAVLRRRV